MVNELLNNHYQLYSDLPVNPISKTEPSHSIEEQQGMME